MLLAVRLLVDLVVHVDHDDPRDPERYTGADHTIDPVHHKDADIGVMGAKHLVLMRRVPSEKYREK